MHLGLMNVKGNDDKDDVVLMIVAKTYHYDVVVVNNDDNDDGNDDDDNDSGALAREAPCVTKSTHPRKFGNYVTVHRPPALPPARPHHRKTNVQSHTFLLVWEHGKTDIAHILHINVVIN